MTALAQSFLESFNELPEREKHEVASAILRRVVDIDLPSLNDEALMEIAAMTLQELDAREADDAGA
jgi:hypothetical protein